MQVLRKFKVPKDIYFVSFGCCNHKIYTLYIHIYTLNIQCTDTILLFPEKNKELCCFDCKVFAASAGCQGITISHFGKPLFCKWLKSFLILASGFLHPARKKSHCQDSGTCVHGRFSVSLPINSHFQVPMPKLTCICLISPYTKFRLIPPPLIFSYVFDL